MDLKLDPHAASLMAGELASDHAAYLRGRVGRDPTAGELYAAHFLGPQGSARLIEATRRRRAPAPRPCSRKRRRRTGRSSIADGRPATVSEVYDNLTQGADGSAVSGAPPDRGFIEYASLRRTAQQAQESALVAMLLRGSSDTGSDQSNLGGSLFSSEMLTMMSEARDRKS